MEKRALLAVVLSILVLGAWQVLFGPRPPEISPVPPPAGEAAAPAGEAGTAAAPAAEPAAEEEEPDSAPIAGEAVAAGEPKEFIVETDEYAVRFRNEGARIVSWKLLDYLDDLKVPLEVVPRNLDEVQDFPLRISFPGDDRSTEALDAALYVDEVADAGPGDAWPGGGFEGKIVTFTFSDGKGLSSRKRIALPQKGYVGFTEVEIRRDGEPAPFNLTWAVGLPEPREDKTTVYFGAQGQGVVNAGGEVKRFNPAKTSGVVTIAAGMTVPAIQWAGLESTYFASLLLPQDPAASAISFVPELPAASEDAAKTLLAARFAGRGDIRFTSVVGPKDYDLLVGIGRDLDKVINFSRFTIIYVITKYLFLALRWLDGFVGNYGLSIIILTIVIRMAFFPITYRSMVSMRQNMKKMQKIQPRIKSIQERYRKMKRTMDSQKKMNDEIMGVYRKEGVNPMASVGGCLPLLLQMPVFIGFYNVLSVTIEMRGAPFMFWVQDLSRMDPFYIFPILMGLSWAVQQWMSSSNIPDPTQRRLMGAMPVIFTFMMARMPSGLVIYWFVSNVLGLFQQWFINKKADTAPAAAAAA